MMNIQKFVAQRKKLGLTQVTLCQGICTQATLSKFERGSQLPSLAILTQLCARLGLGLDDLDDGEILTLRTIKARLAEIEENLMVEDFPKVKQLLKKIDVSQIKTKEEVLRYYLLEGMTNVLTNQPLGRVTASFNPILKALDTQNLSLYIYLAYLGEGIFYMRHDASRQAHFFFHKVERFFNKLPKKLGDELTYAYLTMAYFLAEYHSLMADFEESNRLIKLALAKCASSHRTYYLPRLKLLEAENNLNLKKDNQVILEALEDARAFARLNNNNAVQLQVAALLRSYQRLVLD